MNEVDILVRDKIIPFRKEVMAELKKKHPHILSLVETFLAGKKNKMGLEVLDGGRTVGQYTLHLEGIHVASVETGVLSSEVSHPFLGIVRPYAQIEKVALEDVLTRKQEFLDDTFSAAARFLPSVTIKFLP